MRLSPGSPSTSHCAEDFVIITARGPCALALCWVCAELFPWVTSFLLSNPVRVLSPSFWVGNSSLERLRNWPGVVRQGARAHPSSELNCIPLKHRSPEQGVE